jgi:transcriptional regulator with XRE-family HTH domain
MRKSTHTTAYRVLLKELRTARAAAGLTQRDLGARLKVPHSWVAKVESGERRIDLVEFCWFIAACDQDTVAAAGRVVAAISGGKATRAR